MKIDAENSHDPEKIAAAVKKEISACAPCMREAVEAEDDKPLTRRDARAIIRAELAALAPLIAKAAIEAFQAANARRAPTSRR